MGGAFGHGIPYGNPGIGTRLVEEERGVVKPVRRLPPSVDTVATWT
jgi:hypothetical protein